MVVLLLRRAAVGSFYEIELTGRSSVTVGDNLNQSGNRLQWNVGTLNDYKNTFEEQSIGTAFEVAVTPNAQQVGEQLLLIKDIEVQGRDVVTGVILQEQVSEINSDLKEDAYVADDGRVQL